MDSLSDHPHLFLGASPDSRDIAVLLLGYGAIAFLVFLVIAGAVALLARRYAAKPGDDEGFREAQDEDKFEAKFTVGVVLLIGLIGYFGLTTTWRIDVDPGRQDLKPDLVIIGHQWWWEIRYPGSQAVTANIAHIPKGKRLLVALESADVIHDWWVSGLGRKMDAIPGQTNYFYLEADEVGTFEGACNEFCGLQHAWMRIRVISHEQADYDAWLAAEAADALPALSESAQRGSLLFQDMSCATCHSIRGTEATSTIGPDLSHLASRSTLLSGKMDYSKENLRKWLHDPQAVKPGAHMPRFIFTEAELDDLTDYLDGLK